MNKFKIIGLIVNHFFFTLILNAQAVSKKKIITQNFNIANLKNKAFGFSTVFKIERKKVIPMYVNHDTLNPGNYALNKGSKKSSVVKMLILN